MGRKFHRKISENFHTKPIDVDRIIYKDLKFEIILETL